MTNDNYIHEIYASMVERHMKRQWIAIILLILLLAGTNIYWVYYTRQLEAVVTTTIDATQDGEGVNIISGEDANVTEGEGN